MEQNKKYHLAASEEGKVSTLRVESLHYTYDFFVLKSLKFNTDQEQLICSCPCADLQK